MSIYRRSGAAIGGAAVGVALYIASAFLMPVFPPLALFIPAIFLVPVITAGCGFYLSYMSEKLIKKPYPELPLIFGNTIYHPPKPRPVYDFIIGLGQGAISSVGIYALAGAVLFQVHIAIAAALVVFSLSCPSFSLFLPKLGEVIFGSSKSEVQIVDTNKAPAVDQIQQEEKPKEPGFFDFIFKHGKKERKAIVEDEQDLTKKLN